MSPDQPTLTDDANSHVNSVRAAVGGVIDRWYRAGLLRFNSHDDGSDDLLLRDEIMRALPPEIDVERLAEALFRTQDERLHGGADGLGLGSHEADAAAIVAEYNRPANEFDALTGECDFTDDECPTHFYCVLKQGHRGEHQGYDDGPCQKCPACMSPDSHEELIDGEHRACGCD